MKKLLKYLETKRLTAGEFSVIVGIDHSQMSRYIRGLIRPSLLNAYKIEKITKGKVKMEDWLC